VIEPLGLAGAFTITPLVHHDARGAFAETFRASMLAEAGADRPFVQENLARTSKARQLRGLHFQRPPHAQDKLVQVLAGAVFDVIVDIRPGSATLGRWAGVTLSAETAKLIYVPRGFAHGYLTLTDEVAVLYKTTAYYAPDFEGGLAWDDPALAIDWRMAPEDIATNDRDARWPPFADVMAGLGR